MNHRPIMRSKFRNLNINEDRITCISLISFLVLGGSACNEYPSDVCDRVRIPIGTIQPCLYINFRAFSG